MLASCPSAFALESTRKGDLALSDNDTDFSCRQIWVAWLLFALEDNKVNQKSIKTRMHSSRMGTGRALTVSPGGGVSAPGEGGVYLPGPRGWWCLLPGGGGICLVPGGGVVSAPGGVPAWSGGGSAPRGRVSAPGGYLPGPRGGCLLPGGCTCLVRGGAWSGTTPVNRMTDRCKNITLAKTSFRPVTRMHSSRMRTVRCSGRLEGVSA